MFHLIYKKLVENVSVLLICEALQEKCPLKINAAVTLVVPNLIFVWVKIWNIYNACLSLKKSAASLRRYRKPVAKYYSLVQE